MFLLMLINGLDIMRTKCESGRRSAGTSLQCVKFINIYWQIIPQYATP